MLKPTKLMLRVEREHGKTIDVLMQELYKDKNLGTSEIAKMLNISITTVLEWCRKLSIPIRPEGGKTNFPETLYAEMAQLYKAGISSTDIAKKFSCSNSTVTLALKKVGVKIRNPCERVKRKYSVDESYFENINTPLKAYFLGFIAADGCITKNKDSSIMKIKIQKDDAEIVEKLKAELKSNYEFGYEKYDGSKETVRFTVYSLKMVNDLISHGIIPRKSKRLKPPIGVPDDLMCHFVRGLFDGDGSVMYGYKNSEHLKVVFSGSVEILEWLTKIFEKYCGLKPNKVAKRTPYFATLSYACSKVIAIRNFMYPNMDDFGLKRKKDLLYSV